MEAARIEPVNKAMENPKHIIKMEQGAADLTVATLVAASVAQGAAA